MNDNRYQSEPIRRYRGKRRRNPFRTALLAVMTALIVIGAVIYIMSLTGTGLFSDRASDDTPETVDPGQTEAETVETEPEETEPETKDLGEIVYRYLDKEQKAIHEGDLVLINKEHIYTFPAISLVSMKEYSTPSYALSMSTMKLRADVIEIFNKMMDDFARATGFTDAIVTSAHRSFDIQESLYASNPTGAAKPGYSDYHTGTTVMVQGITSTGGLFSLSGRQEAMWLKENAHKYGFIFRYPSNKKALTGYELPWQLRYVGIPHAGVMYEEDLCLEEYLETMATSHPYAGEHLIIKGGDGLTYEIYYVMAGEEGITKVPVPENRAYSLSGDNLHGFLVAISVEEELK